VELLFEETSGYLDDLAKLSEGERRHIAQCVNAKGQQARSGSKAFRRGLTQPHVFQLAYDMHSSLYALKVARALYVILAVDQDLMLSQTVVRLYRVVPSVQLKDAYLETGRMIYVPEGVLKEQAEKRQEERLQREQDRKWRKPSQTVTGRLRRYS
jgi:hypothetical protein